MTCNFASEPWKIVEMSFASFAMHQAHAMIALEIVPSFIEEAHNYSQEDLFPINCSCVILLLYTYYSNLTEILESE